MRIAYADLFKRGDEMRSGFRSAVPFPYAVIDNLFSQDVYLRIRDSFPPPDSDIWKKPANKHTKNKMVTKRGDHDLKELLYGDDAREVLRELNSGPFLRFLERLTGIRGLLPDPYFAEGGFHCSGDGGFLNIHADFSHHDQLGLERRLNIIFYLNDSWQPHYGGDLSLFDPDLNPIVTIAPLANRAVIFETSDFSYHGHPEPMRLPEGEFRRSVALYYYSMPTGRKKTSILFPTDPQFVHNPSKE